MNALQEMRLECLKQAVKSLPMESRPAHEVIKRAQDFELYVREGRQ